MDTAEAYIELATLSRCTFFSFLFFGYLLVHWAKRNVVFTPTYFIGGHPNAIYFLHVIFVTSYVIAFDLEYFLLPSTIITFLK